MTVGVRTNFRSEVRQATVDLLEQYKAFAALDHLQVYRARPASLFPPTAFIDRISERVEYRGPARRRRVPTVQLIVLHGLFDSGEAADNGDTFVDGFLNWVVDRYHAAGSNTLLNVVGTEDDPTWSPVWLPNNQRAYYATLIALEGLALD
jgi:hypothetical protein